MRKINWGIIGLGAIAQKFSEAFTDAKNSNLLAIASHDYQKLENFRKKFDIDQKFIFKNYEDLLNCKDIDIIYIALPNSLHYHWVMKSIKNNKNILVEKPATLNFEEAENIKLSLLNKDLFFGEAFMYRYHPQIKYVLDTIKSNEIGNIESMESLFGINILTKKKFLFFEKKKKINKEDRKFNKKLGGGCILDLGCYPSSFSLLIGSLANKINSNNIRLQNIQNKIGETEVDIDARVELLFENGFKSKIKASFEKSLGCKSIIKGSKGHIVINNTWKGNDNILITKENKTNIKSFNDSKNIYSYQIEQISENILEGQNNSTYPGMGLEETLINMKILEEWLNGQ